MLFQMFPELAISILSILCLYTRNVKYGILLSGCMINIYLGLFLKKLTPYLIPYISKDEVKVKRNLMKI